MTTQARGNKSAGLRWLLLFYGLAIAGGGFVVNTLSQTISRFIYEVFVVYISRLVQDPVGWIAEELFGPNPYFTSVLLYTFFSIIAIGIGILLYLPLRRFFGLNKDKTEKLQVLSTWTLATVLIFNVFFFVWLMVALFVFARSFEVSVLAAYAIALLEPPSQVAASLQVLYGDSYILSRLSIGLPHAAWMIFIFIAICFSWASSIIKTKSLEKLNKLTLLSVVLFLGFSATAYSLSKISFV